MTQSGLVLGAILLIRMANGQAQAPTQPKDAAIPAETMTGAQTEAAKEVERRGAVPSYL